jgi:hypothetical protein
LCISLHGNMLAHSLAVEVTDIVDNEPGPVWSIAGYKWTCCGSIATGCHIWHCMV